ncbi:Ribosome-binding protein 1 [Babesia ovata]|uniref:Ribosome-binding protein 1 n=1 Tax=Babesia ovata TaxID=189622 RepID=A0A2H6K964_9APIC|nr:Ribosome-binding protein 1 [Babesia ovata]GBE59531.1 Ribosome-binding protein 1 [Babesia ovata]
MKVATDEIKLTSLRDCFMFLYWLHKGGGRNKLGEVAQTMHGRIGDYCQSQQVTKEQIESHLASFLGHVSTFYEVLVRDGFPQEALASGASMPPNPSLNAIFDALLECLPKFLAAIYYLWYCVSHTFESLGGGGWKNDCPGWEKDRWYGFRNNWGGDLQAYLRDIVTKKYNVIPGGFNRYEVRDGWSYSGYSHGYSMVTPLRKIFEKKDDTAQNVFRDVFATSVLASTSGTQISNTANSLALVNVFCEIVVEADENGNGEILKTHVQSKNGCVHWDFLKAHCSTLKSQLGKIFNDKAFSFTGYGRKREELNKEKFAEKTADWLRSNLDKVRENLEHIKSFESEHDYYAREFSTFRKHHNMLQEYYAALGPYFTKNLFPYGFTFYGGKEHIKTNAPFEDFRADWDSVIYELKRDGSGLAELKRILDGKGCRAPLPPPKPRPRPAPAPRPPRPVPQPGRARTPGRTSGPRLLGDWSSSESQASGARGGNTGARGPNNRGGGSGAHSRRGGQNKGSGPGPRGAPGANGARASRSPGSSVSIKPQPLQSQNDSQPHLQLQPLLAASSAHRDPSPPAATLLTPDRLVSQASVHDHSSASSSSSSSSSVTVTGGQERSPQAAASGHIQQSSQDSSPNQDSNPHIPGQHSAPGGGGANGAIGVPSAGGSLAVDSRDTVSKVAEPVVPLSIDLPQAQSIQRQNSLSHGAVGDGDPGSPGPSLPQDRSNHDGAPEPIGTPVGTVPGPDSVVASGIHPVVSSNVSDTRNSNVQTADSLSPPDHHDTAQDLKAQAHSSQDISHQSSHVRSTLQGSPGPDSPSSAPNHAGPGVGGGAGGGGSSAGGTDGDSLVDNHSGISSKAPQHSVQHPTPSLTTAGPPSSGILGSPGDVGLTVQLPPQLIAQDHTGDASGHSPASIPQAPGPDSLSDSDHAVTRAQQLVGTQDNGPLGQLGPALSVPPSPPSAPPLTTAADLSTPQNSLHGPVGAQGVHGQRAMQPVDPISKDDIDSTEPLNKQVSSSPTVSHDPPGKSTSGAPASTSGKAAISQPDDIHGAVLTQSSSVSISGSPSSGDLPSPNIDDPCHSLEIYVPMRIVTEPVFDYDVGEEPPVETSILPDRVGPSIPAVSFNLLPPATKKPLPSREDPKITAAEFEDKCVPTWITQTPKYSFADVPVTELFPAEAPRTVREMLRWLVGIRNPKHLDIMKRCIEKVFRSVTDVIHGEVKLSVNGSHITVDNVVDAIKLVAMFAASVLSTIEPAWKGNIALSVTLKRTGSDQSKETDCCALLCQLRDYVYACCHQLAFLKSQCYRNKSQGGWEDCHYGRDVKVKSPLQDFLTDASDSKFETHPFDPCNICHKSCVRMGFTEKDLPATHETGKHISTILTPSCGGEDPLLTLTSYLTCLTRRTPRTTGELVSFFHNFGNSLHDAASRLSRLGSALCTTHRHCPDWDRLEAEDLLAIKDARGSDPLNSNHRNKDHAETLSTLLGCGIDNVNCTRILSPITYRAYALYSSTYVHHYLSWAVYLADRLWESLDRLSRDMKEHASTKAKPLHQCGKVLPLLYTHGFTPPEGMPSSQLTCSEVIVKLEAVLSGGPIASLMTAMDAFLYTIRAPFLYTVFTLWLIATLYILHSLLYRMDVLRIRSHLLTTRASHLIDVKALLAGSRRMLSLYKDVDYFDDDFHS